MVVPSSGPAAAAVLLPLAHAPPAGFALSPSATSASSSSSSSASSPRPHAPGGGQSADDLSASPLPTTTTAAAAAIKKKKPQAKAPRGRASAKSGAEKKAPKPKKARKRTYYMRKEELARLTDELQELEERNARLQERVVAAKKREAALATEQQNAAINDAIRGHRLIFASAHSMFVQYMRVQEQSPFETFIQLGEDPLARRATLQAMKPQKLRAALEFLEACTSHQDVAMDFREHRKFTNQQGDLCYMSFDVTPLPLGSTSVKSVFDVLLNFAYTFEMSISEVLGDITIRENDDSWDPSVSQHRLVTLVANSVQMETNQVMFTEYFPRGAAFPGEANCAPLASPPRSSSSSSYAPVSTDGQELGVLATDFVNEDKLFPYRPSEHLRQDVTVLTMVKRAKPGLPEGSIMDAIASDRRRPDRTEGGAAAAADDVVVIVRWALIRVRSSSIPMADELRRRLHQGMQKVDEAMINHVRASIGPRPSSFSILHPVPAHHSIVGETGLGAATHANGSLFR